MRKDIYEILNLGEWDSPGKYFMSSLPGLSHLPIWAGAGKFNHSFYIGWMWCILWYVIYVHRRTGKIGFIDKKLFH